ncbi:coatamer subunit protein [Zalerion maritima]|uniref:Coatamer subunit protein n=1 Tax=Zalerion maritima TaxID=339359 RepID=A0AAD5RQA8_9PEZI|nr:coatamer subunit protein [Zalerion maritima]
MPPLQPQPQGEEISQFPDVRAKLQKPTRQSAFDKQRAEAQAKREREAQETAAVYHDFVKSFQDDDNSHHNDNGSGHGPPNHEFLQSQDSLPKSRGVGPSKRHFVPHQQSSTTSRSTKITPRSRINNAISRPISKAFLSSDDDDDNHNGEEGEDKANDSGNWYQGGRHRGHRSPVAGNQFRTWEPTAPPSTSMRAQEKAISKPTLRLSNLPPETSIARVKALVNHLLSVDGVRILSAQPPRTIERRSAVAIVTLSQDTPATDIDSAVSTLQNRYLGYGYYLSLHRHLSSSVTSSVVAAAGAGGAGSNIGSNGGVSAPFGAKPASVTLRGASHHHRHRSQRGRYAPPPSHLSHPTGPVPGRGNQILHVPVQPPRDIKQIRLIHRVLEAVLKHGPEFEALLMSRPEVQRDEKWAWLWDARSQGGTWYRWNLWEIVTGFDASQSRARYLPLFEDSHAWKAPDKTLPFQHATSVSEVCLDPDYSSEDDADINFEEPDADMDGTLFLGPLGRARLAHLLSRLPTNMSRLRKGDIACITAFAIQNASHGAEEIVDMIVWNIEKPFALSTVANDTRTSTPQPAEEEAAASAGTDRPGGDDAGAACLVGLYVANDTLSSSSTSGVRHAWRYRQLFEGALKRRRVFEMLGMMPERLGWGRLRMEKWRRSIGLVLSMWEGWCLFPADTQELLVKSFEKSVSARAEQDSIESKPRKNKWKVVDAAATSSGEGSAPVELPRGTRSPCVGEQAEHFVKQQLGEHYDVDGEPMSDGDIDGEPMSDGDVDGESMDEDEDYETGVAIEQSPGDRQRLRKRMRALDMFAAGRNNA